MIRNPDPSPEDGSARRGEAAVAKKSKKDKKKDKKNKKK
jgi:hypothetical protein